MRVIDLLQEDKHNIEWGLEIVRVSRNLERIADLATNIAEDFVFLAQARVIKHHSEEKKTLPPNDIK
jgi:phosphate transport system protein